MAIIIDPRTNRPYPAAITQPQTAHVHALHTRFEAHPITGITPARLAALLRDAEQGDIVEQAELFLDMEERDGHMAAEIAKRRRKVTSLDWDLEDVKGASAAEKANSEKLKGLIESIDGIEDLLFDLSDGIGKGFSAVEIEWQNSPNGWVPRCFHHRPQAWFRVARIGASEALHLRDDSPQGAPLQPFGWVVHEAKAISAGLARAPLFRALSWPFMVRSFSLGDWSEFLEVYGHPVKVGKYGPTATLDERKTLLRAVVDIGRRAGGIISDGTTIDLLKATEGDPEAFERLVLWADRTQSKLINGGTLTSQADGKTSTNALGTVHQDEALVIRDHDAKRLAATLSRQLLWPIAQLNGLADSFLRCPRWSFDVREPEDLDLYAKALPQLVDIGLPIGARWAADRLRIPAPDPTEPTLQRSTSTNAPNSAFAPPGAGNDSTPGGLVRLTAFKKPLTSLSGARSEADLSDLPLNGLADALAEQTQGVLGDWLTTLKNITERAQSMPQLRAALLDAFGHLPTENLVSVMEAGFALAALQGAVDVMGDS